jgi:hypothetical protein
MFSYCLLLILCRRRFRQGREKSCLFFAGSNSSKIQHPTSTSRHRAIESSFCSVNHIWAAAATTDINRQQDRQVHEGVDGGRLYKDGDIKSSNQVIELAV